MTAQVQEPLNIGVLISVVVLNLTFVTFVLTKLGVWA